MFRVTLSNGEELTVRFRHYPTSEERAAKPRKTNWRRSTTTTIFDANKALLGAGISQCFTGKKAFWGDEWEVPPDVFDKEAGRRHSLGKALLFAFPTFVVSAEGQVSVHEDLIPHREIRREVWGAYWAWRAEALDGPAFDDPPGLSAEDFRLILEQAQKDHIVIVGTENYSDEHAERIDRALAILGEYEVEAEPLIDTTELAELESKQPTLVPEVETVPEAPQG